MGSLFLLVMYEYDWSIYLQVLDVYLIINQGINQKMVATVNAKMHQFLTSIQTYFLWFLNPMIVKGKTWLFFRNPDISNTADDDDWKLIDRDAK